MKKNALASLPTRFSIVDHDDLGKLAEDVWYAVAHECGKIHYKDFVRDCMLHQLEGWKPRTWSAEYVSVIPTEDAVVARDAEFVGDLEKGKEIRKAAVSKRRASQGMRVAEDLLIALTSYRDPDHEWAISVCLEKMERHANTRGIMNGR